MLCWALYYADVFRQQARDRNYIACLFKLYYGTDSPFFTVETGKFINFGDVFMCLVVWAAVVDQEGGAEKKVWVVHPSTSFTSLLRTAQ